MARMRDPPAKTLFLISNILDIVDVEDEEDYDDNEKDDE
jgi:hypothetical protein